jgi:hypothetical protein
MNKEQQTIMPNNVVGGGDALELTSTDAEPTETEEERIQRLLDNLKVAQDRSLSVADARILIEAGFEADVSSKLSRFQGPDQEIALKLIEAGYSSNVAFFLSCFQVLDREVAVKLIEAGKGSYVASDLNKFQGLDHREIAMKLIEAGEGDSVARYLHKFQGLDQEIAMKLIEVGKSDSVDHDLHRFQGLDSMVVGGLINNGHRINYLIAGNLGAEITSDLAKNSSIPGFSEKYLVQMSELELTDDSGALDYKKAYELFKEKFEIWQDEQNVSGPMERGAEVFGYKKMFEYLDNRGDEISLHDKLFFFDSVIKMYEKYVASLPDDKEVAPQKLANGFSADILNQVKMSDSYARLAEITQSIDFSAVGFARYRGRAEILGQHGFAEEMSKLNEMLDGACFDSWKNLQNFAELVDMLGKSSVWEKLTVLKREAENSERKAAMYEYVKTIMFHEDSQVNIGAAEEFFMSPEMFLERGDAHAPSRIHNRKKPSNYFDIPNLDLTAEELVEALAVGDYDKIQTFPGMEVVYSVSDATEPSADNAKIKTAEQLSLIDRVKNEVGSRKLGNANPKLFGELNKLLKSQGIKLNPQNMESVTEHLTPELTAHIENLLTQFPNQINGDRQRIKGGRAGKKYRVRVYDKSDPKAALAGDDTNCCMPFGSGKNNVYTFNPNCGLVTVEMEKSDGGYITIAQSVLTLDQNIGRNVADLVSQLENDDEKILADIDTVEGDNYIACDNVEIRSNYQNEQNRQIIADLYRDFFSRYAKVFNQSNLTGRTVNTSRIVVGQGYSDYHFGAQADNIFVPLAPVSYSDKLGSKVDVIVLNDDSQTAGVEVVSERITTKEQFDYGEDLPRRILPLTYQDSLLAAHLESKAYSDKSQIEGLSAMENSLIAKDINNAIKGRPNMSFKIGNAGYILAYEGDFSTTTDDDDSPTEHGIYIEDLAADPESRLSGGSLIIAFLDQYKKHYIDTDNPLPIFAQMRESTSYPLIKTHLDGLSKRLGVKIEMEELGEYQYGGDTMHKIILRVG